MAAVLLVALLVATQIPQTADIARIGETQRLEISKTERVTADVTVDLDQTGDDYEIRVSASTPDADLSASSTARAPSARPPPAWTATWTPA